MSQRIQQAQWARWIGYNQPGIGTIGAYEGGYGYATGIYRPSNESRMNSLGFPFDAVSREAFILEFYSYVDPLDGYAFEGHPGSLTDVDHLWIDPIHDEIIEAEWYVDGRRIDEFNNETDVTMTALLQFGGDCPLA